MVGERKIGKVVGGRAFVTWRRDETYYAGSPWKGNLATEGGGALINQSIHTLDLLLRYLGLPEQVEASCSNHHLKGIIEVEDTVEAWMAFGDGLVEDLEQHTSTLRNIGMRPSILAKLL